MANEKLEIIDLTGSASDIETCSMWLYERWGRDMEHSSVSDTTEWLTRIAQPGGTEAVLIAKLNGNPVGICMLVDCDLKGREDLTPWLAGLLVLPEFRRQSIGFRLTEGIENLARQSGAEAIYLYTNTAESLYARRGWSTMEPIRFKSRDFVLMRKSL